QFCADHKIDLEEALQWADRAINEPFRGAGVGRADFSTLRTKAAVLEAMGRDADAAEIMDKALSLSGTPAVRLVMYEMRLLSAGKTQKAVEVSQVNARQHPDEPYWTPLGLAQAYTALGDKVKAIEQWELAISNLPSSEKQQLPAFEETLRALKASR